MGDPKKITCKTIAIALFSKLCGFNGSTSKRHISGYNHRRNAKVGLTELYGNTE